MFGPTTVSKVKTFMHKVSFPETAQVMKLPLAHILVSIPHQSSSIPLISIDEFCLLSVLKIFAATNQQNLTLFIHFSYCSNVNF